ncbi:unannotated protein [freshwater metagenome]|uniref:Unannotated protein n=1 Tax=freshwater metagenome TaxID=449393 RepID=A0A6J7I8X5_9ZZZZ
MVATPATPCLRTPAAPHVSIRQMPTAVLALAGFVAGLFAARRHARYEPLERAGRGRRAR